MNTQDLVGLGLFSSAALAAAITLILIFGATLHAETRFRRIMLPVVLPTVLAGIAISTLLSGRNLGLVGFEAVGADGGASVFQSSGEGGNATWPLRLFTVIMLASSFALIVGTLARRVHLARPGAALIVAFWLFFLTNVVLNSLLGTRPDFVPSHFYPIIVFLAAYYSRDQLPDAIIRAAKIALFVFLTGSIVMIAIKRSLVLQQPYLQGWVPGLKVRLWGLGSHANSIGPLALLYVLLEIHAPFKSGWGRVVSYSVALSVIVLAQSKTVWVAGLLLVGILHLYRVLPRLRSMWRSGRSDGSVILQLSLALFVVSMVMVALVVFDTSRYVDRFANSSAGGQLLSLSGRSAIWQVAWDVWKENPLFGYGPRLWDPEFRQSIGMAFAFHAHNQFLQSLSSAGSFGIFGMVIYLGVLGVYSLRFAARTLGLTLALWIFLFIRCLTETPLSVGTLFNGDFFTHLLIFAFLVRTVAAARRAEPVQAKQTVGSLRAA